MSVRVRAALKNYLRFHVTKYTTYYRSKCQIVLKCPVANPPDM